MKKFLIQTVLFCLMLPLLFYLAFLREDPSFKELKILDEALKDSTSIIMFGSSVNLYHAPEDSDTSSISQMLDSLLDAEKVTDISHPAYQADVYLEFCKYIVKQKYKPKIIIIPVNLRYFSPEWDMRPEYQFVRERTILKNYPFYHPFNSNFKNISKQVYLLTPVYSGNQKVGVVSDYDFDRDNQSDAPTEMKNGFIFHYMYPLHPDHRKLKSLSKICKLLDEHHIRVIMYSTPVDYQHGEALMPEAFISRTQENVKIIKSVLKSNHVDLLDLTFTLDSSYFSYRIRPCEHLNMRGRLFVARCLAEQVNHLDSTSDNVQQ